MVTWRRAGKERNWKNGLEKPGREMRMCRKTVAMGERRSISEAFEWYHQLDLRIGEGEESRITPSLKVWQ